MVPRGVDPSGTQQIGQDYFDPPVYGGPIEYWVPNNPIFIPQNPLPPVQQPEKKCTFKICSSPVAGGAAGHLFIICGGDRFRAGPGRGKDWPDDKGVGADDCACRTKGHGQLWPDISPWDDKPLDHPENEDHPYKPGSMKCVETTVSGSCDEVCGCFKKTAEALKGCCVPYNPTPVPLGDGANSNSFVAWMLTSCIVPEGQFGFIRLPGGIRPNPGAFKGRPKCIKEKMAPETKVIK
jgi:hypothetical protein